MRCCRAISATRDRPGAARHPRADPGRQPERDLFCCDPVIGDVDTGSYVAAGIAEFFRDGAGARRHRDAEPLRIGISDGRSVATLGEAGEAAGDCAVGPGIVLVTSIEVEGERIAMLAAGPDGVWAVETPRLPVMLNGCGDVTAALFLARLLRGESLRCARATAASMYGVIETTMRLGRYELALVAAQEELVAPTLKVMPHR